MKELYAEISRAAKLKQGRCGECGGTGMTWPIRPKPNGGEIPCPTCAPLKKWAELEWHETRPRKPIKSPAILQEYVQPCSCGVEFIFKNDRKKHIAKSNRTLDIPELVTMLKELGEWEGFVNEILCRVMFDVTIGKDLGKYTYRVITICTTPDLFREAVLAYLKEVKGNAKTV